MLEFPKSRGLYLDPKMVGLFFSVLLDRDPKFRETAKGRRLGDPLTAGTRSLSVHEEFPGI